MPQKTTIENRWRTIPIGLAILLIIVIILTTTMVLILGYAKPGVQPTAVNKEPIMTPDRLNGLKEGEEASSVSEITTSDIDIVDWLTFREVEFELKYPPQAQRIDFPVRTYRQPYRTVIGFINAEPGLNLAVETLSLNGSQRLQSYCSAAPEEFRCYDLLYIRPAEWSEQKEIFESSVIGEKCSGESLWARNFCNTVKTGTIKFLEKGTFSPPSGSYRINRITYKDDLRYKLSLVDFVPKIIGGEDFFCHENKNIRACLSAISRREVDKNTLEKLEIFDNFVSNFRFVK